MTDIAEGTRVDILLGTYNAGPHLEAQLASYLGQEHDGWHLIARDDGSGDDTPGRLAAFAAAHPGRVTILDDGRGNLGIIGNFAALMRASTAPHAAFSDQDDIWHPNRLSLTLAHMAELEAEHGAATPLMVATDRRVVGQDGAEIARSAMAWLGRPPGAMPHRLDRLCRFETAGNATTINRALLEAALPLYATERHFPHDTWIELVAALIGQERLVAQPTLDWRQHGANLSDDVRTREARGLWDRARRVMAAPAGQRAHYRRYQARAAEALRRYGAAMDPDLRTKLEIFAEMRTRGLIGRLPLLLPGHGAPPGLARKIACWLFAGPGPVA